LFIIFVIMKKNPFHLKGYHGANLFCDREKETTQLISNAKNGVNTTLLSMRRMGKTGLIHHVFKQLGKDKNWMCIYVDIYATQSISEFTNQLASAIYNAFPQRKSIGKKFIDLLKSFGTAISFDVLTGVPEVSFRYIQPEQYKQSLKSLFLFLDKQNIQIIVAIDEFQQIVNYQEKNTEALLRTIIQHLNNVNFIFSGSNKHLLTEMFNSAKRPFFASTSPLYLDTISQEKYRSFIMNLYALGKQIIDKESIQFILDWTRTHTFYTQALCNKIYAQNNSKITLAEVYKACDNILLEQDNIYFQYRKLLTNSQWKLLKAVAKEDKVYQPTGSAFVGKYNLGNPASVKRSLEALEEKEMVYRMVTHKNSYYQVYDCFLSHWLER